MIQALGGEKFLGVREIETRGRFFQFKRNELTGGDLFADFIKFPDKERTEFGKDKNKTVTINNGDEGWKVTGKGVEEQLPAEVDQFNDDFKTSFDYMTRFTLRSPNMVVQHLGSEMIDFKRADIIEIRDQQKNRIRYYVDRESGLPVRRQLRKVDDKDLREELYANYHAIQGVMTAMLITRFTAGEKTMEIRLESAAYDSGLPESLFAPPPAKSR